MSENYLPLILVSALDLATASKLISEIIDNEVIDGDRNQRNGRVWRLDNKYYRADVELCAAPDGAPPPPAAELLEAHVICVTEQGAAAAAAAEARRAALGAAGAAVRLVVAPGARPPGALAAWARRRGYEPVALAERAEPAAGPLPDVVGVQRVRDALHAHAWRGLQRTHAGVAEEPEGGEAEGAVERAEAFAAALGALAAARDAPPADDAERRRRAERVVAAFCRALGADLPRL
ncbi:uncharacterized protein [Maniola hyperantus]|uniref:uncharacterized protein n=1 Tax=Aphantopus hyperantus TaxID=2795564 RepID=UPI0015694885|nr:uncharacterized protein LOC117991934 [Maniola hyperantus]